MEKNQKIYTDGSLNLSSYDYTDTDKQIKEKKRKEQEKRIKEKQIIDEYNNGKSMNNIAREFNTYATTVKRILEKYNVELRHDTIKKGKLYVKGGEKLIEWAKEQGRLVTKAELAEIVGVKRLSPSYFLKYPELGQYVVGDERKEFQEYYQKLYDWLKTYNIPYKRNDKTKLKVSVDVLLLEKYSSIAIQISEKPKHMSKKVYEERMQKKLLRAKESGINIIFLSKEDFENLDNLKTLLDEIISDTKK